MGLFDLPAPLLGAIDGVLGLALPPVLRLLLWGILAGWLTMLLYRRLSNQEKIQQLKAEQKKQQKLIAEFDGEFGDLMPLVRHTLGLGLRQLGLSLGPALLATIPVLFIIVWVAGVFGHEQPAPGDPVNIEMAAGPEVPAGFAWSRPELARETATGWTLRWPRPGQHVALLQGDTTLFELPFEDSVPVIHKRRWWNWLMANPAGYLPDNAAVDLVEIGLPAQQFLAFGPAWMHGWMFSFFTSFLLASVAFKLALRID